ncbi:MAG: DUF2079 domain-containing protein [Chloroflexi bacterium]|nr:DUF2079 domain-containing protein [Chloroflexota bacterium]
MTRVSDERRPAKDERLTPRSTFVVRLLSFVVRPSPGSLDRRHRRHGSSANVAGRMRLTAPAALVCLLVIAYALTAGTMALHRHWNLESQALDMGYAGQVAWNTLHGRPFRFTVFRGDVGTELGRALEYGPGADRDSLLAYHVELIFLPLSLLYLIYPGPEILIGLMTAAIALGALPAYWIARAVLGSSWAALPFAVMYLAFPSIQAANLSDFHAVSMSGTLLLFAFSFLLARRRRAFVVTALISAALKEEVGLLTGMMGLYAWLVQKERRLGVAVAALSFAWVGVCFGLILPHFTGGAPSLFTARYGDALHRLRTFPPELLAGRPALPVPDYAVRHVWHLAASTGFLAFFAPVQLALAAPSLAINGLSFSTWQHGGGAHYSAESVPGLIVAAIFGTRWLAAQCRRYLRWPEAGSAVLIACAGLVLALAQSREQGILPPAKRSTWPAASGRLATLRPLLAQIPKDAAVSAQSNVFPHLASRERIYPYPAVEDAEYVLIDVAGTSNPLGPDDLFNAATTTLAGGQFTVLDGVDGFLLLKRRSDHASGVNPRLPALPDRFYAFARAGDDERFTPAQVTFGDLIDLVGFRVDPLPSAHFTQRYFAPVLYFRVRRPVDRAYRLTIFLIGRDGIARNHDDGNATQRWYPTYRWEPGELIRVRYPPIAYPRGDRLGAGIQIGAEAGAQRLAVTSAGVPVLDGGHVPLLAALP